MTDTPDKEWIERAGYLAMVLRCSSTKIGPRHIDTDEADQYIARELQSSFDQGVERERERLTGPLISARMALEAIDSEVILPGPCGEALDVALAQIESLTPTPTEGERG